LLGGLLGACQEAQFEEPDDSESAPRAIQEGKKEDGYLAVGNITASPDSLNDCTGTLINRSFILTAAHCSLGWYGNHRFSLRRWNGKVETRQIDKRFPHPSEDVAVWHLTQPIDGVATLRVDPTPPLYKGRECVAVGYGRHLENGKAPSGVKRSATAYISKVQGKLITVKAGTGLADHGDSGGPLFCDGELISAVVHGHLGEWPKNKTEDYYAVDAAWVKRVIAEFDPKSPPDPLSQPGEEAPLNPGHHPTFVAAVTSGPLCPPGLMSFAAAEGRVDGENQSDGISVTGKAAQCSMSIDLSVPMGETFDGPEVCLRVRVDGDTAQSRLDGTYAFANGQRQPFTHAFPEEIGGIEYEFCDIVELAAPSCNMPGRDAAVRFTIDAKVSAPLGSQVRLTQVAAKFAQQDVMHWSQCNASDKAASL
jgi:hypothetical protein